MTAAKFGSYIHSDATTPHKGAAIAAVTGGGDFAAVAARLAFGAGASAWADVAAVFPDADVSRGDLGAEVGSIALARLQNGQVGRVDVLIEDRRAALVKVLSTTDFAAKTEAFKAFVADAARAALAHTAGRWSEIAAAEPELETRRVALARELREKVEVAQIEILSL